MDKYKKIVDALRKFPKKSNKEIAARIGVSASYVYKVKREHGDITTADNNDAVGHDATSNGLSWELPDKTLSDTKSRKVQFTPTQIALANRLGIKLPEEVVSDGSTAAYYELPEGAKELQDLISHRNMNAQIGEIFRACYRYGIASHSDELRDAKKIKFYIDAEIKRLEKL
jgi:hypothetical protein